MCANETKDFSIAQRNDVVVATVQYTHFIQIHEHAQTYMYSLHKICT